MRPRTAAAMTVRAVGSTDGPVPEHWQVMECSALSGGTAGTGAHGAMARRTRPRG
jgi:hypothetical protein